MFGHPELSCPHPQSHSAMAMDYSLLANPTHGHTHLLSPPIPYCLAMFLSLKLQVLEEGPLRLRK